MVPEPRAPTVSSPCVSVCVLDRAGRTCTACRRTIEEIMAWPRLDDAAKRAVIARVNGSGG